MKKILFTLILSLLHLSKIYSQQEENLWVFGSQSGLDFSVSFPVIYGNNNSPGWGGTASICNGSGNLLFYTNGFWVWNRNHHIMPLLTGGVPGYQAPLSPTIGYPPLMPWNGTNAAQATAIARMPADTNKYFVFSLSTGGQLYYSVVDMTLEGGLGDIMPGKRSIVLTTGLTEKLTVVKGCNNIWVVVRARNSNEYRAFEIKDTAISTVPVSSNCGNLPISWYGYGVIKFSADGTKMAAACNKEWNSTGGLELYDFDKNTGVISNAQVLDSSSTMGYYYGACFSPDNSKLYATVSSFKFQNVFHSGKVRQFNLDLPNLSSIIASNTVVFTDTYTVIDRLGDLKRGKDDKIYFVSGGGSPNIHAINSPNFAGIACNPVANAIISPYWNIYRPLMNDVAVLPYYDTIRAAIQVTACFKDSIAITADTGKHHLWNDGTTGRNRTITNSGIYTVKYTNFDCKNQEDTFKVVFVKLPALSHTSYSCPNSYKAKAKLMPYQGDTTTFRYIWQDMSNSIIKQNWSNAGDSLTNLSAGTYKVQISTQTGCDTTLYFTINPLPMPYASFTTDTVICLEKQADFTVDSMNATVWKWYFGDGNFSNVYDASYKYFRAGQYRVSLVVSNMEGCSDTAYKDIEVKELELNLFADKSIVNRLEPVRLMVSSTQPFSVVSWEPAYLFQNQSAYNQTVIMDTTRTITVTGISEDGCEGTALVKISVRPTIVMPNAFTPNGDGLNDRFRPTGSGFMLIRNFEVYNRFGQMVYSAFGAAAMDGWDGTFRGQPCEMGTYFYHINMETEQVETINIKGDVTLIR